MNSFIFVQARMGSTRLPDKTLRKLNGRPLIWYVVERLRKVKGVSDIVILTSTLQKDDILVDWCKLNQVSCFRGSEDNVLQRYYDAAVYCAAEHIIRATGDNPFVDFKSASLLLEKHLGLKMEYSSNKSEIGSFLPDGLGVEIFSFRTLERSLKLSTKPYHLEHVNEYILENQKNFKILKDTMVGGLGDRSNVRLTVDTEEDFRKAEFIITSSRHSINNITLQELLELDTKYSN